ncbi:urease accessory protein UreE [Gloeocapsopsis dulcis]|uniref:Urease accessory protein UreE n=1 Tax=Gloeocapsopsis dulcis AAB1 = 1H9 TaxID=1433147 RepID=A0A6N8FZ49_9CHRO|nr:urease accessory protein UreE [Gloeocapsopsis dulcis]MUL38231.1 urease accessory protein UreE [Gloeocapsopsis dulcis AAB1 = 1H9]WNN90287.1 urease accessory protein UreE [Gloeocapsopsis dulcis]
MIALTQRQPPNAAIAVSLTLALTAEERTRSRYRLETEDETIFLRLPRGTVLYDGDLLQAEDASVVVRVIAKPEPVLVVTATPVVLLKAAYHLGNRHVPVEVTQDYLRLSPDPVLRAMLEQLGTQVQEALLPFQPEIGAYGHNH